MATDYGSDIHCIDDIDPSFSVVTGRLAVAQALARRLGTPRGGLFYDPEYGFDLRQFANAGFNQALSFQISAGIEAECVKDERVRSASASVTYDAQTERLTTAVDGISDAGPFRLVLSVSSVTVEVLASP